MRVMAVNSTLTRKLFRTVLGASLVGWLAVVASPALAEDDDDFIAIGCGDQLGPGGSFLLSTDIDCDVDPAITIVGPVKVDLGGHTITCLTIGTGVRVEGRKARVRNGTVTRCETGISVAGNHHRLRRLAATENVDKGFEANDGHGNRFVKIVATGNGDEGIRLERTRNNSCIQCTASRNGSHGMRISGEDAKNNRFVHCVAENNAEEGIRLEGTGNHVIDCEASGNLDEGIRARSGSGHVLMHNFVSDNGNIPPPGDLDFNPGIAIQIQDTLLVKNTTTENLFDGIAVDLGAMNNILIRNRAADNASAGVLPGFFFDLRDVNPDCDDNVWRNNSFESSCAGLNADLTCAVPLPACIE